MGICGSNDKKKEDEEIAKIPDMRSVGRSQRRDHPAIKTPHTHSLRSRRSLSRRSPQQPLQLIPQPSSPQGSMRPKVIQPLIKDNVKVPLHSIGKNTKQPTSPKKVCQNGHPLTKQSPEQSGIYVLGWSCDLCGKEHRRGGVRWHCEICPQDYCLNCNTNTKMDSDDDQSESIEGAIMTPAYPSHLKFDTAPHGYQTTFYNDYNPNYANNDVFESNVIRPSVGYLYGGGGGGGGGGYHNPLENEFNKPIQSDDPTSVSEVKSSVRNEGWVQKRSSKPPATTTTTKSPVAVPRPSGVSTLPPFVSASDQDDDIQVTIEDDSAPTEGSPPTPYQQLYDPAVGKYLDVPVTKTSGFISEPLPVHPPAVFGIRHISPKRMNPVYEGLDRYHGY